MPETVTINLGNVQPLNANLTALAALATASNKMILVTGLSTFSLIDATATGQSILAATNVAAIKTLLSYSTTDVTEGTRLYFTTTRVLSTLLAGLSISGGSIASSDTILEALGKLQNQINGVLGGAIYQSVWNATTNSPTLTSSSGTKGYYYIVNVAGSTNLNGITDWKVGDWAIFNGSTWDKVDNTDAVSSVDGMIGAVDLSATYQEKDATLTALAGLTIAANSLTIGTGSDAFSQVSFAANTFPARSSTGNIVAKTITDFALSLLDDTDAATMRATLGSGTGNGDALTSNPLSQFASTTSLQLLGVISDETGSGSLVFSISPTLTTPILGVARATSIGIGAAQDAELTVSKQATIVAPPSNTLVHLIGLDANSLRIALDTHNNANAGGTAFLGRRSRGTAAIPTKTLLGDTIISFNGVGYGATGFGAASTGLITIKANQDFTDSAMGTYITFFTTPDGSVTAAEALRINGDGSLTVGTWKGVPVTELYGGTGQSSYTLGNILYASATNTLSKLAGNTSTWRKKLVQTGNGTISAAPTWVNDTLEIFMSSGNQTTTSNSAQAITELITPTLEANARYTFMGTVFVGCDNTGGVKIALDIPASATFVMSINTRTAGTGNPLVQSIVTDAALNPTAFCTQNTTFVAVLISGEISVGATPGTSQLMFASGTSTQTSTIYQLGTFIRLNKIS